MNLIRGIVTFTCIAAFALQSCEKRAPEKKCDSQILELVRWLDDLKAHNESVTCGLTFRPDDVTNIDADFPTVKCHRKFIIRETEFLAPSTGQTLHSAKYVPSEDHARRISETTKSYFEAYNKDLKESKTLPDDARSRAYSQNIYNLYISPKITWKEVAQTVEGIVKAGVSDVYFVFNSRSTLVEKPPDNPVMRRLDELRREAEKDLKPNESYILYPEAGAELFGDCPGIIKKLKELFGIGIYERIYFLKKDLPSIIRKCGCVPPVDQIKSLIWHHDLSGYIRVGLRTTLALPKAKGCVEVSHPDDMPWSEAYKTVVKAAEENRGKPLCFLISKLLK